MPIGSQSKSRGTAVVPASQAFSATKFVAQRPKVDNEAIVVVADGGSDDYLPNYEKDLEYFNAVAAGRIVRVLPSSTSLVLHLFRTTQTHIFPIEERLALGASPTLPFFALRASPSLSSVDEYNKLTLTRRSPALNIWEAAGISDIQPRLKLMAQGKMLISSIRLEGPVQRSADRYDLWWDSQSACYALWKNKHEFELEICLEGWHSLDERPQAGFLVAKDKPGQHTETNDRLAIIDFSAPSPQFLCLTTTGHQKLDLIVTALLTVAIVHSRRPKLVSQTLVSHGMADVNANVTVVQQRDRNIRVVV